jgi:DNA-binding transcriptional ArsR family regulator
MTGARPLDGRPSEHYLKLMRPLVHPALDDISVSEILFALADPLRLRIFADLLDADGPMGCSPYLQIGDRTVAKSTLSKQFTILREAGLIRSERKGPGLLSVTRWPELEERYGALIRAVIDTFQAETMRRGAAAAQLRDAASSSVAATA